MRHFDNTARVASAAVLFGLLALGGGCQTSGGGWTFGPQPEEDVWAIRCITLHGPGRFKEAEGYAAALKRVGGLKPDLVQVLSNEEDTTVFYGRYQRVYEGDKAAEAFRPNHLHDMETIRSLRLESREVWPFILASMDVLPLYRSVHPEWDVANADGCWSLHVAVFYNTPTMRSRRAAAEEYCRILREQGEEAYFDHGPARSSVYIGAYPREAVAQVQRENALAGHVRSAVTIVDPRMVEAQKRFPTSSENGHDVYDIVRDPQTGEVKQRIPHASFAVVLPQAHRPAAGSSGP